MVCPFASTSCLNYFINTLNGFNFGIKDSKHFLLWSSHGEKTNRRMSCAIEFLKYLLHTFIYFSKSNVSFDGFPWQTSFKLLCTLGHLFAAGLLSIHCKLHNPSRCWVLLCYYFILELTKRPVIHSLVAAVESNNIFTEPNQSSSLTLVGMHTPKQLIHTKVNMCNCKTGVHRP